MKYRTLGAAGLYLAIAGAAGAQDYRVYVDWGAEGAEDGTSWTDAYSDLQDAIDDANSMASGETMEIWVAEGTYKGQFQVIPDGGAVWIYGGFDGTETSLANRAGLYNSTVLSGDTGTANDRTDNEDTIVYLGSSSTTAGSNTILDGFKITLADNHITTNTFSGAVHVGKTTANIRNCTFIDNYNANSGGAIRGDQSPANVNVIRISDCTFIDNYTNINGGAICCIETGVYAYNCTFIGNLATDYIPDRSPSSGTNDRQGGALFIQRTGANRVFNCVFYDNEATDDGGAIYIDEQAFNPNNTHAPISEFGSCTITNNIADNEGQGIWLKGRTRVTNSVIWNNSGSASDEIFIHTSTMSSPVVYSNIDGGLSGTGNINSDPLFYNASSNDFRFGPGSPSFNAGSNSYILSDILDLDDDSTTTEDTPYDLGYLVSGSIVYFPRVMDSTIDQGAYEVCPADSDMNRSLTGADYNTWLSAWNGGNYTIGDVNNNQMLDVGDGTTWAAYYSAGCN